MKRIFIAILLCCTLAITPALANSWNLSGLLYKTVSTTNDWDDYSATCQLTLTNEDDVTYDFAILSEQYHNVLVGATTGEDGKTGYLFMQATTAVWQPDVKLAKKQKLIKTWNGFIITDGQNEFTFTDTTGEYLLYAARVGEMYFAAQDDYGYNVIDANANETIFWSAPHFTAEEFNISLMPQTLPEVRLSNAMMAQDHHLGLGDDTLFAGSENGGQPAVYAAPDTASYRAAKGKASVSLKDKVWVLGNLTNEQGDWSLVRCQVSQRTWRIGYVQEVVLPGAKSLDFTALPAHTAVDSYLTDDPLVSQYAQVKLPADSAVTVLAIYNSWYAYCQCSVNGTLYRGFVPLKHLMADDMPLDNTAEGTTLLLDQEAMQALCGSWVFDAGGLSVADDLILREDGTFLGEGKDNGRFLVTVYDPDAGLYWNDTTLSITFLFDTGRTYTYGLTYSENCFSLTDEEGGGGYVRVDALNTAEPIHG